MDTSAPAPSGQERPTFTDVAQLKPVSASMSSVVNVTIAGCGGCGINLARNFLGAKNVAAVKYFDTSMTNTRPNEKAFIINGSGSGSHRAENARLIEQTVPQISEEDLGLSDAVIVCFSLAGGSGSVIGPLLIREYARRGVRVMAVAVADTSYSVAAKNTLNTLKTLTAIATNNNIYLPMIIVSNDHSSSRGKVDESALYMMGDLVKLLSRPVYEVDRNDRLNWINPMKVVQTTPGIKLISVLSEDSKVDPKLVLGMGSEEMVDSLMILTATPDDEISGKLLPARLKKTGFNVEAKGQIVGRVSSDISDVDKVIDKVEKMENMERSQRHSVVTRLASDSSDDLIM